MASAANVPAEFLPKTTDEEGTDGELLHLFQEDDANDAQHDCIEKATIAGQVYRLRTPPDVGTLFAHKVWSGSILLAEFLASNAQQYVVGRSTIEFGAGTALPSLVALSHGSNYSVITDYPEEDVLQSLRETVGLNWPSCREPRGRIAVVGFEWGAEPGHVLKTSQQLSRSKERKEGRFDVAILSECLWMHRSHGALAASLDGLLDQKKGVAVVTYAHHVPGSEEADDAFFDICKGYGFRVTLEESKTCPYMWDSTKTIVVYLKVLSRSQDAPIE